jgi:hypothetical protein
MLSRWTFITQRTAPMTPNVLAAADSSRTSSIRLPSMAVGIFGV